MIEGRYNDEDKADTIFPIYLKGTQKKALPTAYFESIFGAKFAPFKEAFEFNYFSNAFDLFSAMRKVSREDGRGLREVFLKEAKEILEGKVDPKEIIQWKKSCEAKNKALFDSIAHRVHENARKLEFEVIEIPLFTNKRTAS